MWAPLTGDLYPEKAILFTNGMNQYLMVQSLNSGFMIYSGKTVHRMIRVKPILSKQLRLNKREYLFTDKSL